VCFVGVRFDPVLNKLHAMETYGGGIIPHIRSLDIGLEMSG